MKNLTRQALFIFSMVILASGCANGPTSGDSSTGSAAAEAKAPPVGAPINLLCEYQVDPIGVDTPSPRLSWRLNDARRGAAQSAYRILVADSAEALARDEGNLWDTGKIESDQSVHVPYAGKPLAGEGACFWKVMVWDADGNATAFSDTARWEMSCLKPEDWKAQWIAAPADGDAARNEPWERGEWIWDKDGFKNDSAVYLRRAFNIESIAKVKSCELRCTADNVFEAFVNGKKAGDGTEWSKMFSFDCAKFLQAGRNVIAVKARNTEGPCGFVGVMRIEFQDSRTRWIQSGGDWKTSRAEIAGWNSVGFFDGAWSGAHVIGKYGCAPWNKPGTAQHLRAQLMRKDFSVAGQVKRARVRVCGLGAYELRINGQKVGPDILTPGWTRFDKRTQYQTYDVTDMLKQGDNCVAVILGSGWWHGSIGGEWSMAGRESLRLLLQMRIETADGAETIVLSDDTWKSRESPILQDSIYDGESYDARLEMPGWDMPGFDASGWKTTVAAEHSKANLVPQAKETIQTIAELKPIAVTEPAPGVFVFDFGQNLTGWARLIIEGKAGNKVVLRHAEVLKPDGNIYTENLRSAKATDEYVLKGGGKEVWEPRFTYHGFRFVEVTGFPAKPTADALTARMICSASPQSGTFECGEEIVNSIQRNILWGARGNMYSVPTDCPQRDERLGWTGDTQIFANTLCWNLDAARFFTKWTRDIRDCQRPDGAVQDVNPTNGAGVARPAWGEACIIVPWQVYRHYGDTRIIEENWDCMVAWRNFMKERAKDRLYEEDGYGDWIAVTASPAKPISAAYYYYDNILLARMAEAIGKDAEAREFEKEAELARAAFNAKFLDKNTNQYPGRTQCANLLPLYFGIVPDDRIGAVVKNVVDDVVARRGHLSTGFLGTGYINPVLTRCGHHDLAWLLATQTTYPSWGYMSRKGATTIWELWNSDTAGPGMNSRNHFCLGSVGEWFYESLAGIEPAEPGFRNIVIRPRPVGNLKWVKAGRETLYGRIASEWKLDGDDVVMNVTIPPNTGALIFVPTFGKRNAVITEGGKPAAEAPGVTQIDRSAACGVFGVGAGAFEFRAAGVGTPPARKYDIPPPPAAIEKLDDDFQGAIDAGKWELLDLGLESSEPQGMSATSGGGKLTISGKTSINYWSGKTLLSRGAFTVKPGERLEASVKRGAMKAEGTGARSGIILWVDSSNYMLFAQDTEHNVWSYNADGRRGPGEVLLKTDDRGECELRVVHDGDSVHLILNGKELADVRVAWSEGMRVGVTGQARAAGDAMETSFGDFRAVVNGR
ncbi:MAG TPA: family 78 glycoside hydrolase catalytic domain [Candidatus Brocadiia bacterium]|nr:family 78 glycoside hydrolase catalytic domain [Candidatus Brocadiia bacterium]